MGSCFLVSVVVAYGHLLVHSQLVRDEEKIVYSAEIGSTIFRTFLDLRDYFQTDSYWRVLRNNLGYAKVHFNGGVPATDKF